MDYPRMLYSYPGPHQFQDGPYDYAIVHSTLEEEAMAAKGWMRTPAEAKERSEKNRFYPMGGDSANDSINDDAPPNRQEMETQAKGLGLKFDGRTPDKKLLAMIEAAMKD